MLLNLLIAMMGDTYTHVRAQAEDQWYLERTRIILQIEGKMSKSSRLSEGNCYWGGDEAPFFQSEDTDAEKLAAAHNDAKTQALTAEVVAAAAARMPQAASPRAAVPQEQPEAGSLAAALPVKRKARRGSSSSALHL